MSALLELRNRIENTQALIVRHEEAAASTGAEPPRSILISIRSLEKLKRRLESEYLEVAAQLEREVYRYRILNDSERVTLASIAEAWGKFQEFFSEVYAALTKTEKVTKKPPTAQRLELGYGYSFASSIGVVVTVPREVGIYAAYPIDEASAVVFDLIEAKHVQSIAATLGPLPIRSLHQWLDVHVRNQFGLGLEWRFEEKVKRSVEIQYQSLRSLQATIGDTTTETGLDVRGELFAVNTEIKEFKLRDDSGHVYLGKFGDAITPEHAASVPARYTARITKTTKVVVLGKEPQVEFFLDRLGPI